MDTTIRLPNFRSFHVLADTTCQPVVQSWQMSLSVGLRDWGLNLGTGKFINFEQLTTLSGLVLAKFVMSSLYTHLQKLIQIILKCQK